MANWPLQSMRRGRSDFASSKMPTDVFAFGDSREMADQLARLVRDGVKTATCSALWRSNLFPERVATYTFGLPFVSEARGRFTMMLVPWPGRVRILSDPPSFLARARILANPNP